MSSVRVDAWASGDAYEPYVGRWSRLAARELLTWLAVPSGAEWLDVGCGTGALAGTILDVAAPGRVQAVDSSTAYVRHARRHITDPRAAVFAADARALPQRSRSVDAVVSGLVLNFVPQPGAAAAEMARVARADGVVAVYVWDYADGMQLMRYFWDAAAALDARARELDEGHRFPLCHPDALEALFRGAGLQGVESRALDVPTRFADFDDYWTPFLGGQGPAPGYVAGLDGAQRAALRERLRAALPVARDGSIELVARAWAVRGHPAPSEARRHHA
ncbi:MAG TPA: class I SAM-dependent methyltransferase [Gemmatimonadaceae bacterium]|nr:class I SAM-dependent methyltransferase [Gemmatimonadaceae bacterium]